MRFEINFGLVALLLIAVGSAQLGCLLALVQFAKRIEWKLRHPNFPANSSGNQHTHTQHNEKRIPRQ